MQLEQISKIYKIYLNKYQNLQIGFTNSSVLAGYFCSFSAGLMGLFSKPPSQLGQIFSSTLSTQSLQKVHSKVQIIASELSNGSDLAQFSHTGLISNIIFLFDFDTNLYLYWIVLLLHFLAMK
jgi:hypothetical protein